MDESLHLLKTKYQLDTIVCWLRTQWKLTNQWSTWLW